MTPPLHATVVARPGPTGWRGALLRGPSGAGKSDLALRLIDAGWRLVADDYAHVWASGEAVYAATPDRIAGRIEARGLDILPVGWRPSVRIVLVVDCVQTQPERMPEPPIGSPAFAGVSDATRGAAPLTHLQVGTVY